VVDALRRIHAALVPGGLLIDTQPISGYPPVTAGSNDLGTLDLRDWATLVDAVDERVQQSVHAGLWAPERERHYTVSDSFGSGTELVEVVTGWQGARVPAELAQQLAAVGPAQLHQEVRLRVMRAV
jgi:hypothetical protein